MEYFLLSTVLNNTPFTPPLSFRRVAAAAFLEGLETLDGCQEASNISPDSTSRRSQARPEI